MWSLDVCHVTVAQKMKKLEGDTKATIAAFEPPSNFLDFWASPSWCTSKEHIFYVELGFWQKEINLRLKELKKWHFKIPLHPAAENGNFTK